MRFPASELMELYQNRWEIELGYREMKHSLQQHRLTLRSKKADGVRQELWGLVLAYNLLRYVITSYSIHYTKLYEDNFVLGGRVT